MAKKKSLKVGRYLLAQDGVTRYIKFEAGPKATDEEKALIDRVKKALGGDVMYINMFDDEFRAKYNIQDFVKANISVPEESPATDAKSPAAAAPKTGVDF